MNWVSYLSNSLIPLLFTIILIHGLSQKIPLFDSFCEGAEEGLRLSLRLLPTFIGLFMAVSCVRASGLLDWITGLLAPVGHWLHFPASVIPVALTKFVSSSAATSLVLDLFANAGPDALESRMAAVIVGSTETILYTLSIYYGSVGIHKSRWTLPGAILAFLMGIFASILVVNLL